MANIAPAQPNAASAAPPEPKDETLDLAIEIARKQPVAQL
jgi:hypothetical protein